MPNISGGELRTWAVNMKLICYRLPCSYDSNNNVPAYNSVFTIALCGITSILVPFHKAGSRDVHLKKNVYFFQIGFGEDHKYQYSRVFEAPSTVLGFGFPRGISELF